jgi:hypothetical protein
MDNGVSDSIKRPVELLALLQTSGSTAAFGILGEFWNGRAHLSVAQQQIRDYVNEFARQYDEILVRELELGKAGELLVNLSDRLAAHKDESDRLLIESAHAVASKIIPNTSPAVPGENPEDTLARTRMRKLSRLLGGNVANSALRDRIREEIRVLQNQAIAELAQENGIP